MNSVVNCSYHKCPWYNSIMNSQSCCLHQEASKSRISHWNNYTKHVLLNRTHSSMSLCLYSRPRMSKATLKYSVLLNPEMDPEIHLCNWSLANSHLNTVSWQEQTMVVGVRLSICFSAAWILMENPVCGTQPGLDQKGKTWLCGDNYSDQHCCMSESICSVCFFFFIYTYMVQEVAESHCASFGCCDSSHF